jgi:energy-coupling factor transporter ATP-binding protein EcfA2
VSAANDPGADGPDDATAARLREEIGEIPPSQGLPEGPPKPDVQGQPTGAQEPAVPAKPNPVNELVKHFVAAYELVHNDGSAYAVPRGASPLGEVEGVPGVAMPFGAELRRKIVRVSCAHPGPPISRATADTVLLHLEAKAFEGPETELALRFHHNAGQRMVVIDLGRADGQAVIIDPDGWLVGPPPPGVVFRRSHATKALPIPRRGGRLLDLAPLLSLDPRSEAFRALVGWLVALPFAAAVRPGLLLIGPYGSGKSTRLRLVASVLEPSSASALGSAFGRNFADDQVRALHRAVPMWDNLTAVSGAVSDELCTLVTGTARETRSLYTDNELNVMPIMRPVSLTAVGVPAGLRPDALDRMVTIDVPPIATRLDDAELQARFDHMHPALLGAVCSAVSAALYFVDKVDAPGEHRMAAHAKVLAALDEAAQCDELDGCPYGLLEAYALLNQRVKQRTAAEDTFGGALLGLLEAHNGSWAGKASELLLASSMYAPMAERGGPGWPSSARRVPELLNHLREGLSALGVSWSTTTVRGSTRYAFTLVNVIPDGINQGRVS